MWIGSEMLCSTKLERGLLGEVGDVVRRCPVRKLSTQIDLVPFGQEPLAEVRAEEAGAAGDDDLHARAETLGRPIEW